MKLPAVDLDDEPLRLPQGIDLEAGDGHVDRRPRQPTFPADTQECLLEVRAGGRRGICVLKQCGERSQPVPARAPVHQLLNGVQAEELASVRLRERTLEQIGAEGFRQVEQGARHARHRDAVATGAIVEMELAHKVEPQSGPARPGAPGDGHVDRGLRRVADAPERSGGAMREDSVGPVREDGRHPPPRRRDCAMPDRIDAHVHAMQASDVKAMLDRASPEPEVNELTARHHSALTSRDLCQCQRTWSVSSTSLMLEVDHVWMVGWYGVQGKTRVCRNTRGGVEVCA
jgi:hypothetical protein